MKIFKINLVSTVLYVGLALAAIFGTTVFAEAAETATACAAGAPTIENFKSYVYEDGELHSFDYTVPGNMNPFIMTTLVDGHSLENRYSTFWPGAKAGERKVHVDVPSWYAIDGEVNITVTVGVAAAGTTTVCATQQSFVVQLPTDVSGETPANSPVKPAAPQAPKEDDSTSGKTSPWNFGLDKEVRAKKDALEKSSLVASISNLLAPGEKCQSWSDATWILLTVVSIALVLVIIDSLSYLLTGGGMRFSLALLALFLVMIGLWFVFDECREYRWFPIVITVITLFTLAAPTNLGRKKR